MIKLFLGKKAITLLVGKATDTPWKTAQFREALGRGNHIVPVTKIATEKGML